MFAQYKFWGQSEPTILPLLQDFSSPLGGSGKPSDHTKVTRLYDAIIKSCDPTTLQVFTVDVTKDLLDYLKYGTLSVEVYGKKHTASFTTNCSPMANDGQHSFLDRYMLHEPLWSWCCAVVKPSVSQVQ